MSFDNVFRFLDLPSEIQQLILWKCLEGWKATVEIHEKAPKRTARVFSSVIYDALMLSLTCKSFHDTIQKIQRDPRLFNGELDMIEVNAQLAYLLDYPPRENGFAQERPVPLYRTQIFIKNKPYDRTRKHWRQERLQYHADVRYWLTQNLTSISLWADEISTRIPWNSLPQLKHITMYWPHAAFPIEYSDSHLPICDLSKETFARLVQKAYNTDREWRVEEIKPVVELVTQRGLSVELHLETPHSHDTGGAQDNFYSDRWLPYKFECQVRVRGEEWTVDRIACGENTIMTSDSDEGDY